MVYENYTKPRTFIEYNQQPYLDIATEQYAVYEIYRYVMENKFIAYIAIIIYCLCVIFSV